MEKIVREERSILLDLKIKMDATDDLMMLVSSRKVMVLYDVASKNVAMKNLSEKLL